MKSGAAIRYLYRRLFVGERWYRLNMLLHELSLHGLGILNYETERVSGELAFLAGVFATPQGVQIRRSHEYVTE